MTMANTMEPLTLDDRLVHRLFREETARWRPGGYEDRGECDGWLERSAPRAPDPSDPVEQGQSTSANPAYTMSWSAARTTSTDKPQ